MTRISIKFAALAALAAATPAAAQWGVSSSVDTQSLRAEIDAGVSRGDISSEEAYSLRSQLRGLINLERQYAHDGLSWSERNDLRQRAQGLRNEIAGASGYASGYGRTDDRYGRYDNGRYGSTYGNGYSTYNNGAYGNRGYVTYDNRAYGNGTFGTRGYDNGQYNQYSQYRRDDRDDAYDRDDRDDEGGYGLRVGERAGGALYAVPDAYRYRFRDSGNVYYRYGNGSIYQIDARTGIVLRIYPIGR